MYKTENKVTKDISIIIPLNNEEKSIVPLFQQLKKVLNTLDKSYEVIFVDDGSEDGTYQKLCEIYKSNNYVTIIKLSINFGQSVSLTAGFDFARGKIIITMDGDFQHDPVDLPRFIEKICMGYEIVNGWKRQRNDNIITRRIPALIVNSIIRFISGIDIQDSVSTYRAYRREIMDNIRLYNGFHRLVPILIKKTKVSICEIEIKCNERKYGKSHYGLGRIKRVIMDFCLLLVMQNKLKGDSNPVYSISEIKFCG